MTDSYIFDPHYLEIRYIIEKVFKQSVSISYSTDPLKYREQFRVYLTKDRTTLELTIPQPYSPQGLGFYIRNQFPEYFI